MHMAIPATYILELRLPNGTNWDIVTKLLITKFVETENSIPNRGKMEALQVYKK